MIQILTQIQFQTSDPITPDGSISAGWVLVGTFVIIGFLLVAYMNITSKNNIDAMNTIKDEIKNIHKRVDIREEEHDKLKDSHVALATRVTVMDAHQGTHAENIANIIINKLYAISPPPRDKEK